MKYDLRMPCPKCPFRSDIRPFISVTRAREILAGGDFACHATVDYSGNGNGRVVAKSQHCAGVLICLEHDNRPHQMMRIAERLGMYDRGKLDMDAPVYRGVREAIAAHRKARS